MENRKAKLISQIERFLADSELTAEQRKTLQAFDRFNELEAQCRLSTRHSYLQTLRELGACVQKSYEEMKKEDLQTYIADQKQYHRPSVVTLQQAHLKRFFRWME
jgi:glycyl-tRNA synthetase alpha subunit